MLLAVALEQLVPFLLELGAPLAASAEVRERIVRDVEVLVRVPAVRLLRQPDLVRPEWCAVGLLAVLLVRAAVADMRADGDQARAAIRKGGVDRGLDRLDVVAASSASGSSFSPTSRTCQPYAS
jgi:hypothetical protein